MAAQYGLWEIGRLYEEMCIPRAHKPFWCASVLFARVSTSAPAFISSADSSSDYCFQTQKFLYILATLPWYRCPCPFLLCPPQRGFPLSSAIKFYGINLKKEILYTSSEFSSTVRALVFEVVSFPSCDGRDVREVRLRGRCLSAKV